VFCKLQVISYKLQEIMDIFVLFGQTATGKTKKAIELVDKYNGEIVNFDSRQIYKKLDIVTGKDLSSNKQFVQQKTQIKSCKYSIGYYEINTDTRYTAHGSRLWLYDIIDPKKIFSPAEYVIVAEQVIKDIIARGKTPILVGGTGYYLRHLLFGVPEINVQEDWVLRKELETKTVPELQKILMEKNQAFLLSMNNSDRNNPRRLVRRIEIANQGGTLPTPPAFSSKTETLRLGNLEGCQAGVKITYLPFFHITADCAREKIAERVKQRIENGALKEVESLLKEGYTALDPGLNAIGYSQLIAYINKELSLDETKKQWITSEIQYAKRQKTYFNKYFPISK